MQAIDHSADGNTMPLVEFAQERRRTAADANWCGDFETSRRLEREADDAIRAGEDPVPMF